VQGYNNSINITQGSINKLNAKIEQTRLSLKSIEIAPILQLGTAVEQVTEKQGKFSAAISRATDLQTVGARIVTQFTRQIIGLGVGLLSMEIGAKAIRSLIEYISQLNFFNPVAKEAELRSKAFSAALATPDYAKAIENITQLRVNLELARDGFVDKDGVIDEYNNSLGKVAGRVDTLDEAEKGLAKNADNFIKATLLKAAAQIILADAAKDAAETAIKNQALQDKIDKENKSRTVGTALIGGDTGAITQTKVEKENSDYRISVFQKEIDENNQRLKTGYDRRLGIIKNFDKQQSALAQGFGQTGTGVGSDGADISAVSKLRSELVNDGLERQKAQAQLIIDDEHKTYAARLLAINSFYNASKAIATNNENLALTNKKLSNDEKIHLENQYQNTLLELEKTKNGQVKSLQSKKAADDKTEAVQEAASAKAKNVLLNELGNLNATYTRKSLTSDEQSLKAISDKYDELRRKFSAFNTDPKNKKNQIGADVFTDINANEESAQTNQKALNQNDHIKTDIEQKKKLYADYEAYKQKVGSETADREYAELLRSGKSWHEYLTNSKNAIDQTDLSGPMQARAELLNRYLLEALEEQKKALEALLISTTTYEDKRKVIIQTSIDAQKKLNDAGYADRAKQVARNTEDELTALDEANFKKLDAYRALFDNIDSLGTGAAKQQLNKLYGYAAAALATGQISIETFNRIIKDLDAGGKIVDDKLPKGLKAMGAELSSIASSVSGFDDNLYKALSTVAALVSGIGAMKENLNTINSKNSSSIEKVTSGLGLVGTAINVVTGVIGYFNRGKESALASAAELKRYQDQLIIGETQYNILLRNRASAQQDITKLTLNELQAREDMLALQKQQAQADYNALLQKIQASGQQINGEHSEKYGGILGIGRKTKVVQELAGLNGADYASLEKLYTEGKLDATTKAWFEQLQNVKNEMDSIGVSAKAAADQINKIATGTTADSIAQAIIDGFKQGKRSAADFADDFKSLMQNAAISVFQSNYLSGKIAAFYQQFADASANGGLTPAKIQALKDAYAKVIGDAGKAFGDLEKVLGTSLTTSSATSGTLSGAIKGITSTEANALEGSIHGMQLAIVQSNAILADSRNTQQSQLAEMRQQTLYQKQIVLNTGRTADNTDDMKVYLQQISANTSGSYGIDQRAAAHYGF
jgi:hypothetical protein